MAPKLVGINIEDLIDAILEELRPSIRQALQRASRDLEGLAAVEPDQSGQADPSGPAEPPSPEKEPPFEQSEADPIAPAVPSRGSRHTQYLPDPFKRIVETREENHPPVNEDSSGNLSSPSPELAKLFPGFSPNISQSPLRDLGEILFGQARPDAPRQPYPVGPSEAPEIKPRFAQRPLFGEVDEVDEEIDDGR